MKLSIIIPAYNEEKTINSIVDRIRTIDLGRDIFKEIVIVNDGSTDLTKSCLERYGDDDTIKIFHQKNMGKTAALCAGIKHATGDILLVQDADLEYNPVYYSQLIAPILNGQSSVVYGSRFRGKIENMSFVNKWANIISNVVFNVIYQTHLTDINTCYKVFKREVLDGIQITSKDFCFETEVTAKLVRKKYKIHEIPIDYSARSDKEGKKINWPKAIHMFWGIIKYRY
ncbi:MAG: glycosyltransferase family 2 protein [Candidatus Omnitrophica bacterium]|nr:glycosyltransferase family 2 protein [Candidatus Omnitrophota bacterium]